MRITLGLLLILSACAPINYSPAIIPTQVAQFGCDPQETYQRSKAAYEGRPRGFQYVPEVGWEACELFAKAGSPRDLDLIETQHGSAYQMFFQRPGDREPHMVTLRQDSAGVWRVATVVW